MIRISEFIERGMHRLPSGTVDTAEELGPGVKMELVYRHASFKDIPGLWSVRLKACDVYSSRSAYLTVPVVAAPGVVWFSEENGLDSSVEFGDIVDSLTFLKDYSRKMLSSEVAGDHASHFLLHEKDIINFATFDLAVTRVTTDCEIARSSELDILVRYNEFIKQQLDNLDQ